MGVLSAFTQLMAKRRAAAQQSVYRMNFLSCSPSHKTCERRLAHNLWAAPRICKEVGDKNELVSSALGDYKRLRWKTCDRFNFLDGVSPSARSGTDTSGNYLFVWRFHFVSFSTLSVMKLTDRSNPFAGRKMRCIFLVKIAFQCWPYQSTVQGWFRSFGF